MTMIVSMFCVAVSVTVLEVSMVKPDILEAVIIAVAILAVVSAMFLPLSYAFIVSFCLIILDWVLLTYKEYRNTRNVTSK
ncbi:hypothetical protein key_112 [Erwinia phage KEY]|uniref:Uncharacterized protein n=2 Tax=Keyvirus TaxID=3152642 RepID=A0AAE7WB12_9CAUD|nr:hypothetical protein key_112 [Erwinia phage KEY]